MSVKIVKTLQRVFLATILVATAAACSTVPQLPQQVAASPFGVNQANGEYGN